MSLINPGYKVDIEKLKNVKECGSTGTIVIIDNDKVKKQLWEEGRPSENLPNERKIFFEKYVDDIIKPLNDGKNMINDIIYNR